LHRNYTQLPATSAPQSLLDNFFEIRPPIYTTPPVLINPVRVFTGGRFLWACDAVLHTWDLCDAWARYTSAKQKRSRAKRIPNLTSNSTESRHRHVGVAWCLLSVFREPVQSKDHWRKNVPALRFATRWQDNAILDRQR